MQRTDVLVRAVSADVLLLEASVTGVGIPDSLVEAAFWWEYMRSSPAAVRAVQQTLDEPYSDAASRSPVARVVGADVVESLGQSLKDIFENAYFPELSWRDAMLTYSLPMDENPSSVCRLSDYWESSVRVPYIPPLEIHRKMREFDEDWEYGAADTFWLQIRTGHSRAEMLRCFLSFLDSYESEENAGRVEYPDERSTRSLPVNPRSVLPINPRRALGWLFVQRARVECGSWAEVYRRYDSDFKRIFGHRPNENDLMARRRRALQIIGWFATGVIQKPR